MRTSLFLTLFLMFATAVTAQPPTPASPVVTIESPPDLVSWNVWFDRESGPDRFPKILNWLDALGPRYILLQEVTPQFLSLYYRSSIAAHYTLIAGKQAKSNYGQVILTKVRATRWQEFPLPSSLQRAALLAQIDLPTGQRLVMINVHLESGASVHTKRRAQIREILEQCIPAFLAKNKTKATDANEVTLIFGGDFNLHKDDALDGTGLEAWVDAAQSVNRLDATFNPEINALADESAGFFGGASRLDRIYLRDRRPLAYEVLRPPQSPLSDHEPMGIWIFNRIVER